MLHMLDGGVSNVTAALRSQGMWMNTLMLFTADNGGIGKFGNNHPLRGHKHDPFEGAPMTASVRVCRGSFRLLFYDRSTLEPVHVN